MFALWTVWYGVQRFLVDFSRLGAAEEGTVSDSVMGPFTGSQWGGLLTAAIGVGLMWWFRRNARVTPANDAELGARLEPEAA